MSCSARHKKSAAFIKAVTRFDRIPHESCGRLSVKGEDTMMPTPEEFIKALVEEALRRLEDAKKEEA